MSGTRPTKGSKGQAKQSNKGDISVNKRCQSVDVHLSITLSNYVCVCVIYDINEDNDKNNDDTK